MFVLLILFPVFLISNYRLFYRGDSSPESPIYTPVFFLNSRARGPEWWKKEGWGSSRCFHELVYATFWVRHFWRLTMSDPAVNTHRDGGFGQNADLHGAEFVCAGARRV